MYCGIDSGDIYFQLFPFCWLKAVKSGEVLRLVFTSDGVGIGKSAYDPGKIENRSHKRGHKLDGIGVGRIGTFPFLPIPFRDRSFFIR